MNVSTICAAANLAGLVAHGSHQQLSCKFRLSVDSRDSVPGYFPPLPTVGGAANGNTNKLLYFEKGTYFPQ